ncbi:MAG: hypothetical protein ACOXZH_09610 [Bacteroidales bacterium]|jgi:hypothetical protein
MEMKNKKVISILAFFTLMHFNVYTQTKNILNDMVDSLLISLNEIIINDFQKDCLYVSERSWIGFGESFVFEVVFDSNTSYIFTIQRASNSMQKKYHKQSNLFYSLKKRYKWTIFRDFVEKNEKWPIDLYDHFRYKFLLLPKKGDNFEKTFFGEYNFKVLNNKIIINNKKIKQLDDLKTIEETYNANL